MAKELKWNRDARRNAAASKFNNFSEDERNCFLAQTEYTGTYLRVAFQNKANMSEALINNIMNFTMESEFDELLKNEADAIANDFEMICGYSPEDAGEAAGKVLDEDHNYSY